MLKQGGLTKSDVKRHLWEHGRLSQPALAVRHPCARKAPAAPSWARSDRRYHAPHFAYAAESINIIVAGGPGTHSVYVPTFGQTRAVSRRIGD